MEREYGLQSEYIINLLYISGHQEVYGPESPTKLFERDIKEWGLRESLRKRVKELKDELDIFQLIKRFMRKTLSQFG